MNFTRLLLSALLFSFASVMAQAQSEYVTQARCVDEESGTDVRLLSLTVDQRKEFYVMDGVIAGHKIRDYYGTVSSVKAKGPYPDRIVYELPGANGNYSIVVDANKRVLADSRKVQISMELVSNATGPNDPEEQLSFFSMDRRNQIQFNLKDSCNQNIMIWSSGVPVYKGKMITMREAYNRLWGFAGCISGVLTTSYSPGKHKLSCYGDF